MVLALRSDFDLDITIELPLFTKLVVMFHLCDLPCCNLLRSTSLLLMVVFPTLLLDLHCILFYNEFCLPTLQLGFLAGHPLGGLVWSIVLFG